MSQAVKEWLGRTVERPDGSQATIPTQFATLDVGAHRQLAKDAKTLVSSGQEVLIVSDKRTREYAEPVAEALGAERLQVSHYVAPDEADGSPPAPDEAGALVVKEQLLERDCALAVSVGSGTINDRTKYAAHLAKRPYLSYATAASMNGYNSPIVAIYVGGLKSSVPATPPLGLYADPEIVAKAPRLMHLAGLGDLCSKPFAGADAVIAATIAEASPWRFPSEMVEVVFEQSLEQAEAIGQDDPNAIAQLMEALWVSGFSMTLAGTSAPASGGEHLWSHRIDMAQHDAGQPLRALHGTQVGIACCLVEPLFGQLAACSQDELEMRLPHSPQTPAPDPRQAERFEEWLQQRHQALSAHSLEALLPEAAKKYDRNNRQQILDGLRTHWSTIQQELQQAHQHAQRVKVALQRAGAPMLPSQMGLEAEESQHILEVCRDIRNRFTILDLTAEILGEEGFQTSSHE